ncbi:MAG: hypothetical protein RIF34_00835, partial [Candidatus Kapaibacterium sp.]
MNKLTFYRTAAIVLLIINLSVIAFFVLAKDDKKSRPNDRKADFKHEVIKILELDHEQDELFIESAKKH